MCVRPIYSFFFCPNFQSNWNEIVDNFDDMNLKESLLRGIYAYGFEKPSAIQQRAIIPCIKGKRIRLFLKMNSLFCIDLDRKRERIPSGGLAPICIPKSEMMAIIFRD